MTRLRVVLCIAALAVTAAAVSVVVSDFSAKSSQASPATAPGLGLANPNEPQRAAAPDGGASSATVAEKSAFAALRQTSTSADAEATSDARTLKILATAQRNWHVNPSLARVAYDAGGVRLVLVPGSQAVCLVSLTSPDQSTDGSSGSCRPIDQAIGSGFLSWGTASNGSPWSLRGVLPDGAQNVTATEASGKVSPIAVNQNGAFAIMLESAPKVVTFTDKDGRLHSLL